jgi:xanthine dioxygenase
MVAQMEPLPLPASAKDVDFGARVTGIDDLAALSDADFAVLERAVHERLVVVIPNQGHLTAAQQLALTRRFDPSAGEYGHGSDQALLAASALQNDLHAVPSAPEVKLLGNGVVASHDEGRMTDVALRHPMHYGFHKDPLPPASAGRGKEATRFFRWHIDAAFYARHPPKVTTLLALEVPAGGRTQVVRYDDGTGDELEAPLAATAFVSGEAAFAALAPEAKAFALAARVRYHPHPYIWMREAKALPTGGWVPGCLWLVAVVAVGLLFFMVLFVREPTGAAAHGAAHGRVQTVPSPWSLPE